VETKVGIEGLKNQSKKLANEVAETKSLGSGGRIREQIEPVVKRQITAQLNTYAGYCEKVIELKQ
jgi:hypothetical protein